MFKIEFTTDNAAFDGDPADECARILRQIAAKLDGSGLRYTDQVVYDINGNRVGKLTMNTVRDGE